MLAVSNEGIERGAFLSIPLNLRYESGHFYSDATFFRFQSSSIIDDENVGLRVSSPGYFLITQKCDIVHLTLTWG